MRIEGTREKLDQFLLTNERNSISSVILDNDLAAMCQFTGRSLPSRDSNAQQGRQTEQKQHER
jgi:hypothetical protein